MVCFDEKRLCALLGKREVFNARSLILTGDVRGLAAARLLLPLFQAHCGIFMGCRVISPLELALYSTAASLGTGEPDSPWIVAISESGADADLIQALEKAAGLGAFTVLITAAAAAPAAKAASRVLTAEPERAGSTLLMLCAEAVGVACRIAEVKRKVPPLAFSRWSRVWQIYAGQVQQALSAQEKVLADYAAWWSACDAFEVIGDGGCAGAARYAAWEILQKRGVSACAFDSEDWCHIPFFRREPETIGTLFLCQSDAKAWTREQESVEMARKVGRTVELITDADGPEFPGVQILRLPVPPEGFSWLFALFAAEAVRVAVKKMGGDADDC